MKPLRDFPLAMPEHRLRSAAPGTVTSTEWGLLLLSLMLGGFGINIRQKGAKT